MSRDDQVFLIDRACTRTAFVLSLLVLGQFWLGQFCYGEEAKPTTFERVFGLASTLDATIVEKVKALPPGERLAIDRDGNGKNDELWFIDNSPRHIAAHRPLLIRVIDEDGDLDSTGPDLDSDLYLVDWLADGVIDRVLDYRDEDHDGDPDQLGIFFGEYQQAWLDKNHVKLWWSKSIGDDNLPGPHANWNDQQNDPLHPRCFSGNVVFYQFALEKDKTHWLNLAAAPFAFYDPDRDGYSEVAVRISTAGDQVQSLRYSIDIDNDAHGLPTQDYEFSITALPEKGKLQVDFKDTKSFDVRGIPVQPVLGWPDVRKFARQAGWTKAYLAWDELNVGSEELIGCETFSRLQELPNHEPENFPQVGDSDRKPLNQRVEITQKPAIPLRLYYDSTDRRLHLLGASSGWINIDANLDGTIDARYSYLDSNDDGVFDRRQADLDADGEIDFDWKMQGKEVQKFVLEFGPLSQFYQSSLTQTLTESQAFIDAAKLALGAQKNPQDLAETFFVAQLASWEPKKGLGKRIRKSPGGARFYLDLIRDRLFLQLKEKFSEHEKWNKVEGAYQAGEYGAAATNITGLGAKPVGRPTVAYLSYTKRIPILIDNREKPQRDDLPITLAIAEIRAAASDFEPRDCAIVAPERWVEWRQVNHQLEPPDESLQPKIRFLADLPANRSVTYYLYYAPQQEAAVELVTTLPKAEGSPAAEVLDPPSVTLGDPEELW